jgi:hypothetical protein|tara:strand:- start:242 stop:391 length:150 start_codon:yes stop_codon:yes gene_type:complete
MSSAFFNDIEDLAKYTAVLVREGIIFTVEAITKDYPPTNYYEVTMEGGH